MTKFVKWEVEEKDTKSHKIGSDSYSFGRDGISHIDIIIIIISAIIVIAGAYYMYRNIKTLDNINAEIDSYKVMVDSKQQTIEKLQELGNNEAMLVSENARNELYIPDSKSAELIMLDIDSIIKASESNFVNLNYGAEAALDNGITDVQFTLNITCTYEQLITVLELFAQTDRLYVIDSTDIMDGETVLNVGIIMHAYYRK